MYHGSGSRMYLYDYYTRRRHRRRRRGRRSSRCGIYIAAAAVRE